LKDEQSAVVINRLDCLSATVNGPVKRHKGGHSTIDFLCGFCLDITRRVGYSILPNDYSYSYTITPKYGVGVASHKL
ncbi:MAG: hypothetical protein ACYC00_22500, partial [Eubacteriales bacterium]